MLRIGAFAPQKVSRSVELYVQHIAEGLRGRGVTVVPVEGGGTLPRDVDLYWDPASTGGRAPDRIFRDRSKPLVVTIHGMASRALPAREFYVDLRSALRGRVRRAVERGKWRLWHDCRTIEVITVSRFAAEEVRQHLPVRVRAVTVVYHGVDVDVFRPGGAASGGSSTYFLHASFFQPLKNVGRILDAYRSAELSPIRMVMVCPGLPRSLAQPLPGVEWILEPLDSKRLAGLLRGALGFVFPSLRESFGLPVLEAMACGCPVITSNSSACAEVAGDAAMLVDPRSLAEIRHAMKRLAAEPETRSELGRRGLRRAATFTWERSVDEHLATFLRTCVR